MGGARRRGRKGGASGYKYGLIRSNKNVEWGINGLVRGVTVARLGSGPVLLGWYVGKRIAWHVAGTTRRGVVGTQIIPDNVEYIVE